MLPIAGTFSEDVGNFSLTMIW